MIVMLTVKYFNPCLPNMIKINKKQNKEYYYYYYILLFFESVCTIHICEVKFEVYCIYLVLFGIIHYILYIYICIYIYIITH